MAIERKVFDSCGYGDIYAGTALNGDVEMVQDRRPFDDPSDSQDIICCTREAFLTICRHLKITKEELEA